MKIKAKSIIYIIYRIYNNIYIFNIDDYYAIHNRNILLHQKIMSYAINPIADNPMYDSEVLICGYVINGVALYI